MTARLTILLGAGGVGKTTLAAGLALAHARAGARVALLGVDPARRVRSALGLGELPELGIALPLPGPGSLDVAVLDPSASLRRWVAEACPDPEARARLLVHPMFLALADRLAGLADAVGCARAAEWSECDSGLDELVLDTAPGVAAVELLAQPDKLLAFFDGRMMRWLVRLARFGRGGRLLGGIGDIAGTDVLRSFGELLFALDAAVATLLARLALARRWLADPTTAIAIVCGVRNNAVDTTRSLAAAVRALSLSPSVVVLNRALPDDALAWRPSTIAAPEARAFTRYVANRGHTQRRVFAQLVDAHGDVLALPELAGLDAGSRLETLASLGEPLRARLEALRREDRSA